MSHVEFTVQTRTRLSQLGVISLLFLPLFSLVVLTLPDSVPIAFKMGSFMTALLFVCWLLWNHSSKPEVINVEADQLTFKYRPPIPYQQIKTFNFDDYLKLKIRGEFWTVLVQASRKNPQAYRVFLDEFKAALSAWQQKNADINFPMPRQMFFYGSLKARFLGAGLLVAYMICVLAALQLKAARIQTLSAGGLIVPICLYMLFSKRRT